MDAVLAKKQAAAKKRAENAVARKKAEEQKRTDFQAISQRSATERKIAYEKQMHVESRCTSKADAPQRPSKSSLSSMRLRRLLGR
jgi:G:T/U-mismatch repair DNA glycosylase